MAIVKTLDISTAHLTAEVARQLTEKTLDLPASIKQDEYGFFLGVPPEDDDSTFPECMRNAFRHAREVGAEFVLFDRDAEIISELPATTGEIMLPSCIIRFSRANR